jgi:hypothetical protein
MVVFKGMAKHCVPAGQTVVTKLPWSHFPTLPERQTIWSVVHGDEKFKVANKLLYPSASARLALKSAGEMVPAAGGTDDIIVGAAVTVSGITEEINREEEDTEDEVFGTWDELLEVVDADVMVLKSMVMIVVESPSDWNPAEATSDDGGVMDSVGRGIKLVLLSEKYGIAVVAAELGVVIRGDWLVVDCEDEDELCVCDDGWMLLSVILETAEELEAVEIEVTDGPVPEVEIKADDDWTLCFVAVVGFVPARGDPLGVVFVSVEEEPPIEALVVVSEVVERPAFPGGLLDSEVEEVLDTETIADELATWLTAVDNGFAWLVEVEDELEDVVE